METDGSPLVYLILGAAGSGRREVLVDLLRDGLDSDEKSLVLLSATETASPADETLGKVGRWVWKDNALETEAGSLAGATHVFFVADGRGNPVDLLEAFKPWLDQNGLELARVVTLVNCRLAEQHPELVAWYDACIHFSDVVLLAHRDGVANKWLSDFQARFRDQYFPCLFEFVKGGRVKNPPLVLEPQARRMSHYFDESEWDELAPDDTDYEIGIEDEGEEADEPSEDDDQDEKPEVDPWFERRHDGRRVKPLPDIAKYLNS